MLGERQLILYFNLIQLIFYNVNCNEETSIKPYAGEYFPDEYLQEDIAPMTVDNLNNYLDGLSKVLNNFLTLNTNTTFDINMAVGVYFMRGIIKRTVMDYWESLDMYQYVTLFEILKKSATLWSHLHTYQKNYADHLEPYFRAFQNPMTTAHSIGEFKSNRMRKWIKSDSTMNKYLEDFDKKVLSKEEYAELQFLYIAEYGIKMPDSDLCLALSVMNPEPTNAKEMSPCKPNKYCYEAISSAPSVAYTLSHRAANLLVYRLTRRCYFDAADKDEAHIESLCAQMYRESVYIARRGFFARDIFMEHVGLCAMMGYREFFRKKWFNKMSSWIDDNGCINENRNFLVRRYEYLQSLTAKVNVTLDQKKKKDSLNNVCWIHVMAVYILAIASAIRNAAHDVASTRLSHLRKFDTNWVSPLSKLNHI